MRTGSECVCVGSGAHLSLLKRVFSNNSEGSDFPSRKAWKVPETSLSHSGTSDTGLPVSLHFPGRGQLLVGPPGRGAPRPLTLQVGSSMEPASIPGGSLLGPWRPALYFSASLPGDTPWSGGLGWPCTHSPREGPGPAQVCGHRGVPRAGIPGASHVLAKPALGSARVKGCYCPGFGRHST